MLLSICLAIAVQGTQILQSFGNVEESEIDIQTASVTVLLSPEERKAAIDLVLSAPQIESLLETADNFTVGASEIFDIREIDEGISLVPKEGIALVTIEISRDYGEVFGFQVVKVTVDIELENIVNTEVEQEVRKPKVHEDPLLPSDLVENSSEYDGVVVTVSGKVSLLGEVFGYLFELDEKVTVFYVHEEATVDVSEIKNGDTVTVTGKFVAPNTVYALEIEKK